MVECSKCGKELGILPFTCRYCGKQFCADHQLPENHECKGLEEWKRGELKEFKKEITSKHYTSKEILHEPLHEISDVQSWIKDNFKKIKRRLSTFMGSVKRTFHLG